MCYRFFQRNLLLDSPVRQLFFLESQEFEKKTSKSLASERKRKEAISESTVKSQRIGITVLIFDENIPGDYIINIISLQVDYIRSFLWLCIFLRHVMVGLHVASVYHPVISCFISCNKSGCSFE